jgi:AraC-like DNA-binding protein
MGGCRRHRPQFQFLSSFFKAMAKEIGLFEIISKLHWHHFFAIDQRTEALCRLLMEDRGSMPTWSPLFRATCPRLGLARAWDGKETGTKNGCSPRNKRAVARLESDFAEDLSLEELASLAKMSRSHFALTFRQLTGHTPHQYLLLVRLNHARHLIGQRDPSLSLAQVAATTGFCDQAHLNRHFRRFFGTTPAAFRSQQSTVELTT